MMDCIERTVQVNRIIGSTTRHRFASFLNRFGKIAKFRIIIENYRESSATRDFSASPSSRVNLIQREPGDVIIKFQQGYVNVDISLVERMRKWSRNSGQNLGSRIPGCEPDRIESQTGFEPQRIKIFKGISASRETKAIETLCASRYSIHLFFRVCTRA